MEPWVIILLIVVAVVALSLIIVLGRAAIAGAVRILEEASEQGFIGLAAYVAAWVFMFPVMLVVSIFIGITMWSARQEERKRNERRRLGYDGASWSREPKAPSTATVQPASLVEPSSVEENPSFDEARQEGLLNALKAYSRGAYNVDIQFSSVEQGPLADIFDTIFWLAGWKTNYERLPQNVRIGHDYWQGVHVWGYDKHLVEDVAQAMTDAGILGVYSTVENHKLKPDDPKRLCDEHGVKIRIGHTDD